MSSNLYWEPTKRKREDVPTGMKLVLRKMYGLNLNRSFDHTDLPMLRGLAAAGVEGADDLIDAIEKHDSIDLTEEF